MRILRIRSTRDNSSTYTALWALLPLLALGAGCTSPAGKQYEQVAKDWSRSMRAQQMIPVYPLSEDLRPGDVFLVNDTVANEAERYRRGGFLSLDDHRARLNGLDYSTLYADGFFKNSYTAPAIPPQDKQPTPAPRVVFPTYTFTVKNGVAAGLGLPVSGVPLALNYSGAKKATGSVTITDASTYAVDQDQLYAKMAAWASAPERAATLGLAVAEHGFKTRDEQPYLILRAVQRVYLARAVDVSLSYEAQASGGGGTAGAPDLPAPDVETFQATVDKHQGLLESLNKLAQQAPFGGTVSFKSFTSRGVSLSQRFDRPLVLGYLGIDVPVFQDGSLGAPVPTHLRLREPRLQSPARAAFNHLKARTDHLEMLASAGQYARLLGVIQAVLESLPADTLASADRAQVRSLLDAALAAQAGDKPADFAKASRELAENFVSIVNKHAASPTRAAIHLEAALAAQLSRPERDFR